MSSILTFGITGFIFCKNFFIWTEPSMVKVFKDTTPKKSQKLMLKSAKNEYESGQIVIRAEKKSLKILKVNASDLKGDKGKKIKKENIQIRLVNYVFLKNQNKYFPDPLPPFQSVEIKESENQPIFITVYVPKDAEAGKYSGYIEIDIEKYGSFKIPLFLEVWDFVLPDKPSSENTFGFSYSFIPKFEGIQQGSSSAKDLFDKYYWFLVEHRISPYYIPVDILDPESDKYIKDERVTSFIIPYNENIEEMRKRVEYVKEKGVLNKAYFYPLDEPVTQKQYEELKRRVEKIKSIDPNLRIVSPFFRDPDFIKKSAYETLDGLVNIWCAVTNYFDPEKQLKKKERGDGSWWYVCCGPMFPYANFHIDMEGISHRILMWQQKKYKVDGLLYWSTNYWNETVDPWEDMATVKSINPDIYGDGSLIYPGKKIGFNGPVSSLRLEIIRDGFEDYEYLTLLEKIAGRELVENIIENVVKSMIIYTRDPLKLEETREILAKEILKRISSFKRN